MPTVACKLLNAQKSTEKSSANPDGLATYNAAVMIMEERDTTINTMAA